MISFGQSQRRGQTRPGQAGRQTRIHSTTRLDACRLLLVPLVVVLCFVCLCVGSAQHRSHPCRGRSSKGIAIAGTACLACLRSTLLSKQHDLCFVLRAVRITRCLPTPTKPHYPIPIPNRSQESVHGHPLPVDVDVWHLIVH